MRIFLVLLSTVGFLVGCDSSQEKNVNSSMLKVEEFIKDFSKKDLSINNLKPSECLTVASWSHVKYDVTIRVNDFLIEPSQNDIALESIAKHCNARKKNNVIILFKNEKE